MPSQSRQLQKLQDRQASWDRLRDAPWSPFGISRAFGSGQPRVQIVSLPSFSTPVFWEVCERASEWLLYSSYVVNTDWSALTVQEYKQVPYDGEKLKTFFERLIDITLPIAPDLSKTAGLDGGVIQLALFGDLFSQVRYQWWSVPPAGWTPLVQIATEMLEAFAQLGAS
jgi:hypothetical protein